MADIWEFTPSGTGRTGTVQTWTVPYSSLFRIEVEGASGGRAIGASQDGGRGAAAAGDFFLQAGTVVNVLVGQRGAASTGSQGAGAGGGTFVYLDATDAHPLIVAGGGGGGDVASTSTRSGRSAESPGDGHGASGDLNGGAGWLSDGGRDGGLAPRSGGTGGSGTWNGGFGGGAAGGPTAQSGGGGGGFSGGAAHTGGTSYISADAANRWSQAGGGAANADGRVTVTSVNSPPFAPSLVAPVGGAVVPSTMASDLRWTFEDPDGGDSQSAYRARWRPVGTVAWVDTGWVTSTSSRHLITGGTLVDGDYEWQVATKDAIGVEGPFSSSGFFTAATPPPGPSVTSPANGAVIPASSGTVTWSVPDQDAYQLQVLDGETVVFDTGQVNTAAARSRVVDFPTNDVTRTIQLRVLHKGLWSPWAAVTVTVSYTAPAVPSIVLQSDDTAGSITVTPGIPAPAEGEPAVVAFDVWVREVGDTGDGKRLAAGRAPSQDYTWWTPASGTDYEFRIQARGDNDTTTWSAWAGGPARWGEFMYGAAVYA